jgi:hypothetical protein
MKSPTGFNEEHDGFDAEHDGRPGAIATLS